MKVFSLSNLFLNWKIWSNLRERFVVKSSKLDVLSVEVFHLDLGFKTSTECLLSISLFEMLLVSAKLTCKTAISSLFFASHASSKILNFSNSKRLFQNIKFSLCACLGLQFNNFVYFAVLLLSFSERCDVHEVTSEGRWTSRLLTFSWLWFFWSFDKDILAWE